MIETDFDKQPTNEAIGKVEENYFYNNHVPSTKEFLYLD